MTKYKKIITVEKVPLKTLIGRLYGVHNEFHTISNIIREIHNLCFVDDIGNTIIYNRSEDMYLIFRTNILY